MATGLTAAQMVRARLSVRRMRSEGKTAKPPSTPKEWEAWLRFMFPAQFSSPFAPHHRDFWRWLWAMDSSRPSPFVAIWTRGGGKSSATEVATAAVACRGQRKYVIYVSETQDQADKRVSNISVLLQDTQVERHYPSVGRPATGRHGRPMAWRRERLHCHSGFVVDALGMETAARGLKVGAQRPDLIIFDELDGRHDTPKATEKKIVTITETILPMGSPNMGAIAVQNVLIPDGVFGQLASGKATFLADRIVSGPIPAVCEMRTFQWFPGAEIPQKVKDEATVDLSRLGGKNDWTSVRSVITHGEATWEGQNLRVCQELIDTTGLAAFLRERQHEVDAVEGAIWNRGLIRHVTDLPPLKRVVTGVDPSGGIGEIGIVTAGVDYDGRYYVLADDTQLGKLGPANWGRAAVAAYEDNEGDRIVAEVNFGGDMVVSTIQVAGGGKEVPVKMVRASRGKAVRAEPIVALYEEGRVFHVGAHPELETEQCRWVPGTGPSPNRVDALVWALTELSIPEGEWFIATAGTRNRSSPAGIMNRIEDL